MFYCGDLWRKIQILFVLTCAVFATGCARQTVDGSFKTARSVARASKAMVLGAGFGSQIVLDMKYTERDPNPNAYVGGLLYGRYCEKCHSTGKAPELIENRVTPRDAESDYYIILYGLTEMKGYRRRLTKFQILDILAYIRDDLTGFNPDSDTLSYKRDFVRQGAIDSPEHPSSEN